MLAEGQTPPNILIDLPRQQLTGVTQGSTVYNWKTVIVSDSAKTWVMFKSNTTNSIWIPLTSVSWAWSGKAIKLGDGTWQKDDEGVSGPTTVTNLEFPFWNANVNDSPYTPE